MITISEAKSLILAHAKSFGTELVSIHNALHRVLAEDVLADRPYPPFNRSAMDGYAISYTDWQKGIRRFEVKTQIHAGDDVRPALISGNCYKIMTGAAVPTDADVVIRVEDAILEGNTVNFAIESIKPWQNIAKKGEDTLQNEMVIPKGSFVSPALLAGLAVFGKKEVLVKKNPSVSVISTGNEVVPITLLPNAVEIRDSNSYSLVGFLDKYKIPISFRTLVKDEPEAMKMAIEQAIEYPITILSGGVSAGDADFVPSVLAECGVKKIFHKVQIKPGKPLWFGITPKDGVVFALPGNPVSVQVGFLVFIEPFIRQCLGLAPTPAMLLPLLEERKRKVKLDEYFPCKLTNEGQTSVFSVKNNGSGDIRTSLLADGFALHPVGREVIEKGEAVLFLPI